MVFDPVTIIVILVALVALWFLFRILLSIGAAIFRFGCFLLFVGAIIVAILYFLELI